MEEHERMNRLELADGLQLVLSKDTTFGRVCAEILRSIPDREGFISETLFLQSVGEAEEVLSKFRGQQVDVFIDDSTLSNGTSVLLKRVIIKLLELQVKYIIIPNAISQTGNTSVKEYCIYERIPCADHTSAIIYGNDPEYFRAKYNAQLIGMLNND